MPAVVGMRMTALRSFTLNSYSRCHLLRREFESRTTLSCDLGQSNVPDNGGRKLDHITLEALRLRAVAQIEGRAHPEDVAGRRAASADGVRVGGEVPEGALKAKPMPGRAAARRAFAAATSRTCATSGRAKGVPPGTGVA
jgi:hypothetical protein